jgi:hypothetical protein
MITLKKYYSFIFTGIFNILLGLYKTYTFDGVQIITTREYAGDQEEEYYEQYELDQWYHDDAGYPEVAGVAA